MSSIISGGGGGVHAGISVGDLSFSIWRPLKSIPSGIGISGPGGGPSGVYSSAVSSFTFISISKTTFGFKFKGGFISWKP